MIKMNNKDHMYIVELRTEVGILKDKIKALEFKVAMLRGEFKDDCDIDWLM